ncbi:MAG TPA: Bax inhibitor-1/YccA family protein [Candidatus Omnitrophota bacterium]|nr:Bax inhibitor-1/YccA family protein [Candidatus Omnitrophota bacterium]
MTLNGTIGKTALSLAILFLGGFWSWRVMPPSAAGAWMIAAIIITLILALITCFKPQVAPRLPLRFMPALKAFCSEPFPASMTPAIRESPCKR